MLAGLDLQQVRPDYWLELSGALCVIVVLAWLALRLRLAARVALLGLVAVLALRVILFDNPLSWALYVSKLDADAVGWRQHDLVRIERERFNRPPAGLRYLAVGSSQTGAVYSGYAGKHADFDTFVVAAMTSMDFMLYSDDIVRRRPGTVLLYLSDFDIAKKPSAEAAVVSPRQGVDLVHVVDRLRSIDPDEALDDAMVQLIAGELLPEFKFRFIFRGLVDQQFRRAAARLGTTENKPRIRATVEERIGWLRGSLAQENLAFNLAWLEDFLDKMDREGIRVVMVEGHYHPAVNSADTARLNREVRDRLSELAHRSGSAIFVPRTGLYQFSADDYGDLTHVKPEAGEQFVRELIGVLEP